MHLRYSLPEAKIITYQHSEHFSLSFEEGMQMARRLGLEQEFGPLVHYAELHPERESSTSAAENSCIPEDVSEDEDSDDQGQHDDVYLDDNDYNEGEEDGNQEYRDNSVSTYRHVIDAELLGRSSIKSARTLR